MPPPYSNFPPDLNKQVTQKVQGEILEKSSASNITN